MYHAPLQRLHSGVRVAPSGGKAGTVAVDRFTDHAVAAPPVPDPTPVAAAAPAPFRLRLLRSFGLSKVEASGRWARVDLPLYADRLLAFLALRPDVGDRVLVASTLWLDTDESRAAANLRTALWRIRQADAGLVVGDGRTVGLGPGVSVDLRDAVVDARLEVDGKGAETSTSWERFRSELLPEWYDDWVIVERERYRQLRLHALEALAFRLSRQARHAEAVDAAQAAVAAEPLRETAQRTLIAVHLAEGNRSEARRQALRYQEELRTELGVDPSEELLALVR